jgi:hypothetical protein
MEGYNMAVKLSALRSSCRLTPQKYYFSVSGTRFCLRLSNHTPPPPPGRGLVPPEGSGTMSRKEYKQKTNSVVFSPQANYTD